MDLIHASNLILIAWPRENRSKTWLNLNIILATFSFTVPECNFRATGWSAPHHTCLFLTCFLRYPISSAGGVPVHLLPVPANETWMILPQAKHAINVGSQLDSASGQLFEQACYAQVRIKAARHRTISVLPLMQRCMSAISVAPARLCLVFLPGDSDPRQVGGLAGFRREEATPVHRGMTIGAQGMQKL